jgi:hypothetical protein
MAEDKLNDIMDNSNLIEVLIGRVTKHIVDKPVEAMTNVLICDNRLKASIIFDDQHVVEVLENEQAHYKRHGETTWRLRKRGRLAKDLVMQDK